jgi:CheY-like chemotaxis protein
MPQRVLLVEDEPMLLSFLTMLLEDADIQVRTATNGLEALDVLEDVHPDAVVSDLRMPDMDGLELLHRVRENPDLQRIPFILLTGMNQEASRFPDQGIDRCLPKPFDPDVLLSMLQDSQGE